MALVRREGEAAASSLRQALEKQAAEASRAVAALEERVRLMTMVYKRRQDPLLIVVGICTFFFFLSSVVYVFCNF